MSRGICLVIEDDEDIAGRIGLILTREGFDVRSVRTASGRCECCTHGVGWAVPKMTAGDEWQSGIDDLGLARHPDGPATVTEGEGDAASPVPVDRIRDLDVHVRFGAVARVAALGDGVAHLHWLPRLHLDGALAQMCQEHEGTVVVRSDHDVVPSDGSNSCADSFRLAQHVWHECQLRSASLMIRFAVMDGNHRP
jgi:hypothetical protein